MTPDDLAAIAALAAAATPGPWISGGFGPSDTWVRITQCEGWPGTPVCEVGHNVANRNADAAFIAAARTAVPALLAHIATLTADALALHDALARVTRERDAAVAARDALAGAVHVVRVAFAATTASGAQYGAAWDAVDAMPPTALQSEGIAAALRTSYEAQETLEGALTALLDGAPADVVRGDVVRAYLAAADALPGDLATINAAIDKERAARAALDAALLAAKGAP